MANNKQIIADNFLTTKKITIYKIEGLATKLNR